MHTNAAPFHPETLVGNTFYRLQATDLFSDDWPLTFDHLVLEVHAVLRDVWGWPETAGTAKRARGIATVIARHVAISEG